MANPKKDILEILDRYCSSAVKSKDDKTFFICAADYVKAVVANSLSNNAIVEILEARKNEYQSLEEFEKKAIAEIEMVLKKLKSLKVKNKEARNEIDNLFLDNEKYVRGEKSSTQTKADRLFGYAREIIGSLRNGEHKEFVNQYIKYHPKDPKIIISYAISEAYDHYVEEESLMKYKDDFLLGSEWNNLVWAFKTIHDVSELMKTINETEKKEAFLWFGYYDRYKEMTGIMEGKKEGLGSFFNREDHQRSLIRINNYLSQELLSGAQKKLLKKDQLDTTILAEGEPIKNIKICKSERKFYILINDKKPFELPVRNADEKNKTRYWDLIISIAEKGNVEPEYKSITGVLSYFNSSKANPILKVFNFQRLLEISGEFIYPRNGVKIEPMKDAIRKKYFNR